MHIHNVGEADSLRRPNNFGKRPSLMLYDQHNRKLPTRSSGLHESTL